MINRMLLLLIMAGFTACKSDAPVPKPRAYPRVTFPERKVKTFSYQDCPFTFEFPDYAVVDTLEEPCWFDLFIPVLDARVHCSYMPVRSRAEFDELVRDAFVIANKINERANYMEESRVQNAQGIGGLKMEWTGPAASPVHFFLSDTTQHFFRAALYYNTQARPDSLAPITLFLKEDIERMIQSFSWTSRGE